MGYPVLRLTRRFTQNGAPAVGTAYITETGSNNKVRLYADAAGTQQITGNAVVLDADGQVDCYVRAGNSTFRVTVKSAGGFIIAQDDAVVPISDNSSGGRISPPASTPIAYAATITPAASDALTHIAVGTLTGNITVANPTKAALGILLVFTFTQDGTGSRTITWGANFSLAAANGAGTANQIGATAFLYNGTKWVQIGGGLTFHAP
jgi:hypothetical protein